MQTISRRRMMAVLSGGLAATAGLSMFPRGARAAAKITVLNWQGYGTDQPWALKKFGDKTGISVVHDYFNSEAEMLTKLRTNPGVYDVVLINSGRTQQAAGEGLIAPLDLSKIANSASLAPELRDHSNFKLDGKIYGCAWLWGMTSAAIRDGLPKPESYNAFADPKFKDKVALLDDPIQMVAFGALMTGQDINNPKDLKAVGDKLKSLKPNIKKLWSSEDEWNKSFAAKEFDLSMYWSGAIARSIRVQKLPVQFVVPKEGGIGWLDGLSVPATSKNVDAALAFINYMIDPDFYYEWATTAGAPASANTAAMAKLPEDNLVKQIHKPEYLKTMSINSALPDDRRTAFNDLWQEVKAFYAS
jgi:spermidine/putrescine transport system substrate-binding protein